MIRKCRNIMKNNKGISETASFIGWMLIAIMFLYGIVESALLFTSVVKMNNVAELLSKKIQLSGTVNAETQKLLNDCLKDSRIHNYEATVTIQTPSGTDTVTISESTVTTQNIQLNNSYAVIVTGDTDFCEAAKKIGGKAVGISEVYSK